MGPVLVAGKHHVFSDFESRYGWFSPCGMPRSSSSRSSPPSPWLSRVYPPIRSWSLLPSVDSKLGLGGPALCLSEHHIPPALVFTVLCILLFDWTVNSLRAGNSYIVSQIKLP